MLCQSSGNAANQKDRINCPLHILKSALSKEGEHATLASNFQFSSVGYDLKRINLPSGQAIRRGRLVAAFAFAFSFWLVISHSEYPMNRLPATSLLPTFGGNRPNFGKKSHFIMSIIGR